MKNKGALNIALKSGLIVFALIKSMFSAVTQVAWGLVSLLGLNVVMAYILAKNEMILPPYIDQTFLKISMFIVEHIMAFVWIFFILACYFEIKEVLKK